MPPTRTEQGFDKALDMMTAANQHLFSLGVRLENLRDVCRADGLTSMECMLTDEVDALLKIRHSYFGKLENEQ